MYQIVVFVRLGFFVLYESVLEETTSNSNVGKFAYSFSWYWLLTVINLVL